MKDSSVYQLERMFTHQETMPLPRLKSCFILKVFLKTKQRIFEDTEYNLKQWIYVIYVFVILHTRQVQG